MQTKSAELRGVLEAYKLVIDSCWPRLHSTLGTGPMRWPTATLLQLHIELSGYLEDAGEPPRAIRVFWKFGDNLQYGGLNLPFATDAGFDSADEMVDLNDFDPRIPWTRQAAKYQADDREVISNGAAMLDILERQEREDGLFWLHTGKAPIRAPDGDVLGILGVYETIDSQRAMDIRRRTGQI